MSIDSITKPFMCVVEDMIDNNNGSYKKSDGFLGREVGGRLIAIKNIALTAIATAGDCFKGILFAVLSFATVGLSKRINKLAGYNLMHSMELIPQIFRSALQIINPKSELDANDIDGFFTQKVVNKYLDLQSDLSDGNWFKRNVLSRAIHLILIPTSVIARVADFALGVIAAVGAVLTVGKFEKLNSFAYKNLQVMQIVRDLWFHVLQTINPNPAY